jgi:hypothetical protein
VQTLPDYVFHCAGKIGGLFAAQKYQADFSMKT